MTLEEYLHSNNIDATIEFNSKFNIYNITFATRKGRRQISIDITDINNDFSLIGATILATKYLENQLEHGYGTCHIKIAEDKSIFATLSVDTDIRDTTVRLVSGTKLDIDIIDPQAVLEMHFTREVHLYRDVLAKQLRNEIDKLIKDVKTYCK
jgi:hypothetical protein